MAKTDTIIPLQEEKEDKDFRTDRESPITPQEEAHLIRQVEDEYQLSWNAMQGKRTEWLRRLKLYNNQKRDPEKVGDPLLFTVFNTVLADLYNDRFSVQFSGREEGDEETAENLNATAEHDHSVMEKDELDYEWDWDACFFGTGLMLLNEFDRDIMTPVAEVIDRMVWLNDPRATSINGNQKGYGAMRFGGREIGLSRHDMFKHPKYFNVAKLKKDKDLKNLTDESRQQRRAAQGRQHTRDEEENLRENYEFNLLEWMTTIKGKKYLVTLGNNRKVVVRYQKLQRQDMWSIIDRRLFPMAKDFDGVTIPDLIEDKQRARAVMINLGMESAKADLYPMYLYDKTKIGSDRDLSFAFNKYIPVKGSVDGAMTPIQKSIFHQQTNLILDILSQAAEKAVAAPEVAQGVQPKRNRTLGETQEVLAGVGARHSLGARIFGWSDRRFWQQWYWLYKVNFTAKIDTKMIRIQGALAPTWRKLTPDQIRTKIDPDVTIEIASIVEAKRQKEFIRFSALTQIVIQDPEVNRRYLFRRLATIGGAKRAEMQMMFPPTIDEMRAEDENMRINENKLPKANMADDDAVHIEIHSKAAETPAKLAHIENHKAQMMFKKENPDMFPQPEAFQFNPVTQQREASAGGRQLPSSGQNGQQESTIPSQESVA